jgi:aspartate-semialdehyde dehydrogenase
VKPNCSIQSYVPAIHPLMAFGPKKVAVCTYQAISGAGKTFESWPEMVDNVIPFIKGEEEKSEKEPLKIWGSIRDGKIVNAAEPVITAQCLRVPVSDGHMAAVFVGFERKPAREQILSAWREFAGKPQKLALPSAPKRFLTYFEDDARPQTRLDRDAENGQGVTIGRLRPDAPGSDPTRRNLPPTGCHGTVDDRFPNSTNLHGFPPWPGWFPPRRGDEAMSESILSRRENKVVSFSPHAKLAI